MGKGKSVLEIVAKIINRINFRLIVNDIFHMFFISCTFSVMYFFLINSANVLSKSACLSTIKSIFQCFLLLKLLYEIFLSAFLNSYNGWIINKNVLWSKTLNDVEDGHMIYLTTGNNEIADYNDKVTSIHEAGHALMTYILGPEYFTVKTSYTNSHVAIHVDKIMQADDLQKHIFIDYAGAIAEEILLGKISTGSMGTDHSDFEQAARRIREYLILTVPGLSKTGLDDGINQQIVCLSKEFYEEAKKILLNQKEEVEKLSGVLRKRKTMTRDDIEKIIGK